MGIALAAISSAYEVSIITFIKRARRLLAHLEGPILLLSGSEHAHAALVVLQGCVIATHSVLAMSYLALARYGHQEGKQRCIYAIADVVKVTKTLKQEDMDALDPFTIVGGRSCLHARNRQLTHNISTVGASCSMW
jgi:hypothetical protein